MNNKKSFLKKVALFLKSIVRWFDKKIITPVTKFVLLVVGKFGKRTDKFEKWLVRKNTLIMISLLLAIVLFFSVNNKAVVLVDSYAEVLYDQKVEAMYNNESYVIEGLPDTVDVTLIGRKVDMYLAKQLSTGTVSVDLSNLKPGTHKVNLNYESVINSINYTLNPSSVTVIVYPKVSSTKTATIDVINRDSLNTKMSISNVTIDQSEIIIKGAEHTISEVATVRALVDIKKLVDPQVGVVELDDVPLIAYDNNGKVVDVEMVPSKVTATINLDAPSKEVPIKIVPVGEVLFGKAINTMTSSESKVTIYGSRDIISNIEYIPIEVDVTNLSSNKEFNVSIPIPKGVRELSVNNTKISITLGNEETTEINDVVINSINLDPNYKAQAYKEEGISDKNENVVTTVVVKGTSDVLKGIDKSNIKAVVDLSGLKEGVHEVAVIVTGDDARATYSPKITKIKIRIIKANG